MTRGRRGDRGSVLVVVAALLAALVAGVLLLADLGLRLEAHERLVRAADAAALAAAVSLCDRDAGDVARAVAAENAAGLGVLEVDVELGALDDTGAFTSAATPSAVRVRSSASVPALFAGGTRATRAAATAALRRFGVVSLASDGAIRLFGVADQGAAFAGGEMHANGDVVFDGAPALDGAALSAGGAILASEGGFASPWSGGAPAVLPRSASGVAPLRVPPVDGRLLDELRARADVVYTPGSPVDATLYGVGQSFFTRFPAGNEVFDAAFFFDLTAVAALGERPVIFFDAPATIDGRRVAAALQPRNGVPGHALPNDPSGATRGLVFVSTVPVVIQAAKGSPPGVVPDVFGGEGAAAVAVYGASDVWIRSGCIDFAGAVIRAGRDIDVNAFQCAPRSSQRVRLVADGDVQIVDTQGAYDLGSGPPCPPAIAHAVRPAP